MKNSLLFSILALVLFCSQTTFAQQWKKQRSNVDFRVGLLPTFSKDDGEVKVLPLSLNYDYRIAEKISVGAYLGYSVTETSRQEISDGMIAQWRNRFTIIGIRAAAHTNAFDDWDVYGGFSVGYNLTRLETLAGDASEIRKHKKLPESSGRVTMSGFVGARYALTDQVGISGEIGFGISLASLGVSYKF